MKSGAKVLIVLMIAGASALLARGCIRHNESATVRTEKDSEQNAIYVKDEEALEKRITQFAASYDAVVDWGSSLTGGTKSRFRPLLSVELQDVWVTGVPILFRGRIEDMARDGAKLRVEVTGETLLPQYRFYQSELKVSALCTKEVGAKILAGYGETTSASGFENVAIVVKVLAIDSSEKIDEEGDRQNILIGRGECIDAILLTQ